MKARAVVVKGLLEVLVLDALYREPRHGYGLIKDLEEVVGTLPGKNQIYPLLTRLEEQGLIESREEPGDGGRPRLVYSLTHKGEKRLTEYKALPPMFKDRILGLWGHGSAPQATDGDADADEADEDLRAPVAAPPTALPPASIVRAPEAGTAWVHRFLEALPPGAQVSCPHAEVELRRQRATGSWTINVRNATVAAHPGHNDCALCFVIQAASRLLFNPGSP